MLAGENPISWMEAQEIARFGFKPVKHRKFVERAQPATAAERAALLLATQDVETAAAAAAEAGGNGGGGELRFDAHLFHTTMLARSAPAAPLA